MNRILCCVAFAAALPVLGERAGGPLDPVGGLTSSELVAKALTQNGELRAGEQQVASARGGVTQARLKANPSVSFNESQELLGGQNNFMLGGSLPLELYHRRERRVEVAQAAVRVSEFGQADRERLLRAEVESKFGDVLAAARNLQVVEDLLALNRKALDLTQARADQGAAPPLDANLLRVEVNRIDSQRVELEARVGLALLDLKRLAGVKPGEDLRLKGSLDDVGVGDLPRLQTMLESRPDLLSVRAAEQLAGARVRQAETEAKPDASFSVNYQRMDSSFAQNGLNSLGRPVPIQGIFHFAAAGVTLTLPTRNRNQGAIESAVAQSVEARHRREYAELVAAQEFAAAALAREKAEESLRIYRERVREQASQNLEVVRRTYELGRTQLLDVIGEQRRFIDIEMGYTEALNRYYQAVVRQRFVTGGAR
jgi:outer membrane protein, heavy metal efflux system